MSKILDEDVSVAEIVRLVAGEPAVWAAIWASDEGLARFWALVYRQGEPFEEILDLVCSSVKSVRDLRCLIRDLDEEDAIPFLDDFVLRRASSEVVIRSMAESRATYEALPKPGAWVGHALYLRGAKLLNDHPRQQFEIAYLVPIGVDADRASARALLSSAAESNQLTASALAEARRLYPNERSGPLASKG